MVKSSLFTPHTLETMITMLIKVLYINSLLLPRSLMPADQYLLAVPRSNLKTKGDGAFGFVAPRLRNSLPLDLRSVDTTDTFSNKL